MPGPNTFAYLMLVLWPAVSLLLWQRLEPGKALIWTILGGYLSMPMLTSINLPILPDLDKDTIPCLAAFAGSRLVRGDRFALLPQSRIGKVLALTFIFSPVLTVLANGDPSFEPGVILSGIPVKDSITIVISRAIELLPLFLARHYLGSRHGIEEVLTALVWAGLIYSAPIMLESLVSPQLHFWVYGFFQHDFLQSMRQGGYRPMVFLEHGLWVAMLIVTAFLAALTRTTAAAAQDRPRHLAISLYLLVMLVLCKSAGVLIYAAAAAPLILFASARLQIAAAAFVAVLVIFYPILRAAELVPVDQMVGYAASFSQDRAQSLQYRFNNEELLLQHARQRPLFGWGEYERNLLHQGWQGAVSTIADGGWIIALGTYGWAMFLSFFGLSALPLLSLARRARRLPRGTVPRSVSGLAMILAASLADLIPNATHVPMTWMITGALLGLAEAYRKDEAGLAQERVIQQVKRTVI